VSLVSNVRRSARLCLLAALLVLVAAACDDSGDASEAPTSKTTPLVRSYRATGVRLDLLRSGGTFAATFERAAPK
jgi:hypothetical protein